MSWVTWEPKSTMRILSWPASRSVSASRTREESRTVIPTLCARRGACGQGRCFWAGKPAVIGPPRRRPPPRGPGCPPRPLPHPPLGVPSLFQFFLPRRLGAPPFLDLFQPAIGFARFVGVVLIEESVHPALPRRFARIFRGDGRGKHGISG